MFDCCGKAMGISTRLTKSPITARRSSAGVYYVWRSVRSAFGVGRAPDRIGTDALRQRVEKALKLASENERRASALSHDELAALDRPIERGPRDPGDARRVVNVVCERFSFDGGTHGDGPLFLTVSENIDKLSRLNNEDRLGLSE